jgi:hypothetical protein
VDQPLRDGREEMNEMGPLAMLVCFGHWAATTCRR